MSEILSLLQPLKDRLAAAHEWDVCDGEQTVRSETGEIIYDRSGYDRSEWVGEYRPIAELIAAAPTDQAKLIAAIEAVAGPVGALMAQLVAREERWKAAWESGELTHDEAVSATQEDRWAYGELAAIRFALTQALGGDTA